MSAVSVFHEGELAVQRRAGVRGRAERTGAMIGSSIDAADRRFLSELTFVIVGGVDERGRMWATLLLGPPGFILASESHLQLKARPHHDDPLAGMRPGAAIGLLAIDPVTRRRLRVNGQLTRSTASGFELQPDQVYRNCPKYIQARAAPTMPAPGRQRTRSEATALSDAQQRWIAAADTFFIVTRHPEAGADTSHRGGMPGFLPVPDAHRLSFPDYVGNDLFNTLGNLTAMPQTGLLFCDFAHGRTLQLTGTAHVDWDPARSQRHPGAQRVIDVKIDAVIQTTGVFSPTPDAVTYSRSNPPTDQ